MVWKNPPSGGLHHTTSARTGRQAFAQRGRQRSAQYSRPWATAVPATSVQSPTTEVPGGKVRDRAPPPLSQHNSRGPLSGTAHIGNPSRRIGQDTIARRTPGAAARDPLCTGASLASGRTAQPRSLERATLSTPMASAAPLLPGQQWADLLRRWSRGRIVPEPSDMHTRRPASAVCSLRALPVPPQHTVSATIVKQRRQQQQPQQQQQQQQQQLLLQQQQQGRTAR